MQVVDLKRIHRRLERSAGRRVYQKEIAKRMGLSRNFVNRLFTGEKPIPPWFEFAIHWLDHIAGKGEL